MTPERLAKIRALAEDARGDPKTREIARSVLERHKPPPRPDPRHPGVKPAPDYEQHRFMDLNGWKTTVNGNPTFTIMRNGHLYRVVLFKHKKSPTWGWMRINTDLDETEFSGKFGTIGEAHGAAWASLMEI